MLIWTLMPAAALGCLLATPTCRPLGSAHDPAARIELSSIRPHQSPPQDAADQATKAAAQPQPA